MELALHPHDAAQLARSLMIQHGLSGWAFRFDHARRRFGSCRYGEKTITLSRPLTLLNDDGQVRDTVLHEIAHALCPGDGHGPNWKAACRRLGADRFVATPIRPCGRPPGRLPDIGWGVNDATGGWIVAAGMPADATSAVNAADRWFTRIN